MRSRTESQSTMQDATKTAEQVLRAYKLAGSVRRPGSTRLRRVPIGDTSSSERGRMHQKRSSSHDSVDDRKTHALAVYDNPDTSTECARLKVTYGRRQPNECEPKHRPTGNICPQQPSLQQPRRVYPRIDWSQASALAMTTTPRSIYVEPLPEDREEFEIAN